MQWIGIHDSPDRVQSPCRCRDYALAMTQAESKLQQRQRLGAHLHDLGGEQVDGRGGADVIAHGAVRRGPCAANGAAEGLHGGAPPKTAAAEAARAEAGAAQRRPGARLADAGAV